jgi:hypothetical protein
MRFLSRLLNRGMCSRNQNTYQNNLNELSHIILTAINLPFT